MREKKTLINIISSLALQLIMVICNFIFPRLIIKKFGSNVNGLLTSITQFLAYITLLESGFGPVVKSLLYKPIASKDKSDIEKILKSSEKFFRKISYIFIGYIIVLSCILPMIMSNEFNKIYTLSLIIIISISTFAEYFFGITYRLYLQAEQKTYIISIIQIGTLLLSTAIMITSIYFGANIQEVKLLGAIIYICRPILQNTYVKKKYKINLRNVADDYEIKQKWDGLAQHIASVIHNNTDVAILTFFSNTTEISVYAVYSLIITGIKNIVQAFTGGVDAAFGDMIAKKEKENLNKNFKIYELFYFTLITIIFITTLLLIVPFVSVYTKDIKDANYHRPTFAMLLVLAEFLWTIRLPYSSTTLAAGHFKETMKGAWLESGLNVIISIVLVFKFGIIGVAIGTLVAMFVRTIEFMYHTSKHILDRSFIYTLTRLLVITVEMIIVVIINMLIPNINIINYSTWIIQAIIIFVISTVIVVGINIMIYTKDFKLGIELIKRIISKKQYIQKKRT